MITIATNMAGRGTDIVLGGNVEKLVQPGGRRSPDEATRRPAHREAAREWQKDHEKSRRWAACASSPPSATKAAASTTSCAAARAARATRARRAST
jgi:preprotein translocase subunit SecA